MATHLLEKMGLGIKNLFEILRACDQLNVHDSLMKDYKADPHIFRNSNLKTAVADALISLINPLRSKLEFLYSQRQKVEDQLVKIAVQLFASRHKKR